MRLLCHRILLLSIVALVWQPAVARTDVTPVGLTCEYAVNPLGLDTPRPRLSWQLQSSERGQRQSAYQVRVASRPALLQAGTGDLWDSGVVRSAQSVHVEYAGRPLRSHQQCFWQVRVWDRRGQPSPWSQPATWTMGILSPQEWRAQWITYTPPPDPGTLPSRLVAALTLNGCRWIWFPEGDPRTDTAPGVRYFRCRFNLPAGMKPQAARALFTADDQFVLYVNGQRAGASDGKGFAWQRAQEIEVAALLVPGQNVLAVAVTNSAPSPAGLAGKLVVQPEAGELFTVITDGTWRCSDREVEGWQQPGFADDAWVPAHDTGAMGIAPWHGVRSPRAADWGQDRPGPLLRKAFRVRQPVKRATVYVCGLGYYELRLNGRKVGDRVLDPPFTRYDRRCLYTTYDVTAQVRRGENALGVVLGNGWYNQHAREEWDFDRAAWRDRPKLLLHLRLELADGSIQTLVSDRTWRGAAGPIRRDGIRNGELYDARRQVPGWDRPGFDDRAWARVAAVKPPQSSEAGERPATPTPPAPQLPAGAPPASGGMEGPTAADSRLLRSQTAPPIRVTQTLKPVRLSEPKPGVFIFDLGQAFAGWAQLRVRGPAGTRVTLRYGERLDAEGMLTRGEIETLVYQGPFQTDVYILKGQGLEVWEPRFTYHGFRYVEVTGFPGRPTLDSLRGRVVHTDFAPAGTFACSNDLLNRIQRLTLWAYRSNFVGYPTDCPQREKNGWTGDAHLAAEQGLFNWHSAAAYARWMNDFKDEQRPNGELPGIVPTSGWGYGIGPAWDSAYVLIPWYLYVYCGDTRVLAEHYPGMKRYVDYLTTRAKDHLVDYGLGDWVPAKTETPVAVTSTAYYYVDALTVARAARLLGKHAEAEQYAALAAQIRQAFRQAFVREDGGVANNSQTALSGALFQGMVDPDERERVLGKLVADIERQEDHLDTGILGAKYLFHALTEGGRADLAYRVATQTTFPSYGYWIRQGATTLWEDWRGAASRNHVMFGDISAWFYKALAGINPDPAAPGFQHVILRPHPVGDLRFVRATYRSPYGTIVSDWRREGGRFRWRVRVPPNSTATAYMPCARPEVITEGGKPAARAEGVRLVRVEAGATIFTLQSGHYTFACPADR